MTEKMFDFVKRKLSEKRFIHTMGTTKIAEELSKIYNLDPTPVKKAAMLHDIAKDMPMEEQVAILKKYNIDLAEDELKSPGIIHGYVGAIISKIEFDIEDEVYDAIFYHPTGHPDFKNVGKILFLADYLDPSRRLKRQKDILNIAKEDFSNGIVETVKEKINYIILKKCYIHPLTIKFYNKLIENYNYCKS